MIYRQLMIDPLLVYIYGLSQYNITPPFSDSVCIEKWLYPSKQISKFGLIPF